MYQIGEKVVDRNGKVFQIDHTEDKDFGSGSEPYFVLTPVFQYDFNTNYHVFVPVKKSEELYRPVMSEKEALDLIDSFSSIDDYPNVSPRERKVFFTKVISSGNRYDTCRVIKSLITYRDERAKTNKPVSDFDRKLLSNLLSILNSEIALALSMNIDDVRTFVTQRTGLVF